jgi:Lon protease-like protein
MHEIPLFPLSSVLFPGMSINLHIFEERYKQMINLCLETRQPFGVVLIAEGQEAYGRAKPHMIGCTAQIIRMQPLGQGRMDISAIGLERFTIQSLQHDRPYLVGQVELWPIKQNQPAAILAAANRLKPWVRRYLELLAKIENVYLNQPELPDEPVTFGYLAAAILQQVSQLRKQQLLEAEQALSLLRETLGLYQLEVSILEQMLARSEKQDDMPHNLFSNN